MAREKKVNLLVVGLLLALSLFFFFPWLKGRDAKLPAETSAPVTENTVIIRVGDEEKLRIPLSKPQTVTITQPTGEENVIAVTESGVRMEHSTCHNQICVNSGVLTPENMDFRRDGPFIICLPNQVSIELVVVQN